MFIVLLLVYLCGHVLGIHPFDINGINNDFVQVTDTMPELHIPLPHQEMMLSPKCWQSAVMLLNSLDANDSISDVRTMCTAMPDVQQKWLALEISRCHLHDLGKALFQNIWTNGSNCKSMSASNVDSIYNCLKNLTPIGETTYTIYVTYVQNLCIRLTQELILQNQQDTQQEIFKRYAELSMQSIQQLRSIAELSDRHATQLAELVLLPGKVKAELSDEFSFIVKESVQNTLDTELTNQLKATVGGQLNDLVQVHQSEQEQFMINLMDKINYRDEANRERFEEWAEFQVLMWQRQTRAMELQHERFNEHRQSIESLSATVSLATERMQPIVHLQDVVKMATTGYTLFTFVLYTVCTLNVVWLVTLPKQILSVRSSLYKVIAFEVFLELVLISAAVNDWISETDRLRYVTIARRFAIYALCTTYFLAMLLFFVLFPLGRIVPIVHSFRKAPSNVEQIESITHQNVHLIPASYMVGQENLKDMPFECIRYPKSYVCGDLVYGKLRQTRDNSTRRSSLLGVIPEAKINQHLNAPATGETRYASKSIQATDEVLNHRNEGYPYRLVAVDKSSGTSSCMSTSTAVNNDLFFDAMAIDDAEDKVAIDDDEDKASNEIAKNDFTSKIETIYLTPLPLDQRSLTCDETKIQHRKRSHSDDGVNNTAIKESKRSKSS